jgi:glucokinase
VVLGIDFGATNLKALLLDPTGRVRARYSEPSEPAQGPVATLGRVIALVRRAREKSLLEGFRLEGVGVGVCGPVDHRAGELVESPVLPGWHPVRVQEVIAHATGLPVHVDNDANLAVLGEWWLGAGNRSSVVAGLTLGTGIGGGLVIDGRVFRGSIGFGAEFGHVQVADSPACPCGGTGCLGRVASGTATLERYRAKTGAATLLGGGVLELDPPRKGRGG